MRPTSSATGSSDAWCACTAGTPKTAAALIDQHRLTTVVAPAAMTGDLVRVAQAGRHDLGSLLYVGGGGAARAPEQVRQIRASFTQALPNIGWGMTETNAIGAASAARTTWHVRPARACCSQVLQLQVVDDDGRPLPAGERGELLVRGTSVFRGYWNRPEANAQAFVGDWFRTGDVALIDDEGYLYIVDRIKDLIIRGGENIGCGQVEAALLTHPDVQEAAVYAVPDERLGEEVGATVYGSAALDPDALRAFLAEQAGALRGAALHRGVRRSRCRARRRARSSSARSAARRWRAFSRRRADAARPASAARCPSPAPPRPIRTC
jgi:long-chain acyl-CoA synthetase